MMLVRCALQQKSLRTTEYGVVRAEIVTQTFVQLGSAKKRARLVLIQDSLKSTVESAWVDDSSAVIDFLPVNGVYMDRVRADWASGRDQLLQAEVNGATPNCHAGGGAGSCEHGWRVCNLPGAVTSAARVTRVTIADSGYSIQSDGKGPYGRIAGATRDRNSPPPNVRPSPVGVVAGLLLYPSDDGNRRFYSLDLDHPIAGDIGRPLGKIKVDGQFPSRFTPTQSSAFNELAAHANTTWNYQQQSLGDLPIGSSMQLEQLDLDFYLNGVMHVLQMGPQPYGHCRSTGTAIYGDGTTKGTLSRPDSTHWILDLPKGSVGRLFENKRGDEYAVNRGLYNVSMHLILER
jgi:hypothetical protein